MTDEDQYALDPAKLPFQSYTALTHQVVHEAEGPIPVTEIMRRVHNLRAIESQAPERLIRHAVSQSRLITNNGDGSYWWYPRMLKGSRVRVPLIASDLKFGRLVFDYDARDLLWPSFYARSEYVDRDPIQLRLGAGDCVSLQFEHFGEGVWGTTGSTNFWNWLSACEAAGGDALIFEAIDAESRLYRVDLDAASVRDESAIRRSTDEIEKAARDHMWKRRVSTVAIWDLAQHLLAIGCYKHPVPPDPISSFWRHIEMQIGLLRVYADEFAGMRSQSVKKGLKKAKTKSPQIYQLKVTLYDIAPPIWRRFLIAGDTTLGDLHWILQLGMGWTHSHLHYFEIGGAQYSDPSLDLYEDPDEFKDEFRARLDRVVGGEGERFLYEYDFGDCWRHEIEVEKILPVNKVEIYPKIVDGERACPPEDCGGVVGYAIFLKEIGDENHPDHEQSLAWAGEYFDSERFDLEGVNWVLRRFAGIK